MRERISIKGFGSARTMQKTTDDHVLIDTILKAQAVVARHIAGERVSAEETINQLARLLDSFELVKELAKRGYSSKAFK
jgi:hypothetical protein